MSRPATAVAGILLALASWSLDAAAPSLFLPAVSYDSGGGATESVVVSDVNRDGAPDLVVALQNDPGATHVFHGLVAVLLGRGDGTFGAATTYDSAGMQPFAVAVGDLNNDGKPDIVVANYCVYTAETCSTTTLGLLLGRGDGSFDQAIATPLAGSSASAVAIADVNNDGIADLATTLATNAGPAVEILLGNGDATFRAPVLAATGGDDARSVVVGDVNGDAAQDLVTTGNASNGAGQALAIVSVLLGNGNGTFRPAISHDAGGSPGGWANAAVLADLNADGRLDVAVADYPDDRVGVLLGNGDGSLGPVVSYGAGARLAWSLAAADLDGDGRTDLAVANAGGELSVLAGNGDGTFAPPQSYQAGPANTSITAADLNRDGRIDLAVTNGNRSVSVLLNAPRCLDAPPAITLAADPAALWPPTGKVVSVTVTGTVSRASCTSSFPAVTYAVNDEYSEVQAAGRVAVRADGTFTFVVRLPASRRGNDADGRQYTITARAQTVSGGAAGAATVVTVLHDRGR